MAKKKTRLVILGATAFPEISQVIRDANEYKQSYEVIAILDDNKKLQGQYIEGVMVKGPLDSASHFNDAKYILNIASYRSRLIKASILDRLKIPDGKFETIIHPAARIYSTARIGNGCVIFPGVVVFCNTQIDNHVMVLANSIIGVNNHICEGVSITSLVSTASNVTIGHFSHIGTGSCIADNVIIEPGAQIGMGSVVLKNIPAGGFCLGNPARVIEQVGVPAEVMVKWQQV